MRRRPDAMFELAEFADRMGNPRKPGASLAHTFEEAVDGFRRRRIPFVLHGAWAMSAYGYRRATEDIDFLLPAGPATMRALYALMEDLGAIPAGPGPRNAGAARARGASHVQFLLRGWRLDFFLDGAFRRIHARARRKKIGSKVVPVIAPRDLIERKERRGTLQDLADIARLRAHIE